MYALQQGSSGQEIRWQDLSACKLLTLRRAEHALEVEGAQRFQVGDKKWHTV
jgi:hypothetical protein